MVDGLVALRQAIFPVIGSTVFAARVPVLVVVRVQLVGMVVVVMLLLRRGAVHFSPSPCAPAKCRCMRLT